MRVMSNSFVTYFIDFFQEIEMAVTNCQVRGGYIIHVGTLEGGQMSKGDKVMLTVDKVRSKRI